MSFPVANIDADGEDLLPLSALNDLLYCDRRCWLHRVAGLDEDNVHTVLGQFDHQRANEPSVEKRPGVRVERALPVLSRKLGLIGRADVVEFQGEATEVGATEEGVTTSHEATEGDHCSESPDVRRDTPGEGIPLEAGARRDSRTSTASPLITHNPSLITVYPVEYKHGPKRKWDNDDVQLCAQALCLEEMLGVAVPAGAIFHVTTKRRREVTFDEALRLKTVETAAELHRLVRTVQPPPARLKPQCEGCAMRHHCLPEAGGANQRLSEYLGELYEVGGSGVALTPTLSPRGEGGQGLKAEG